MFQSATNREEQQEILPLEVEGDSREEADNLVEEADEEAAEEKVRRCRLWPPPALEPRAFLFTVQSPNQT